MWNAAVSTLKQVPNHANRWRQGRCGMATLEELFKTSIKLSLWIYILLLLLYSGSIVVYILAVLVPLLNVAMHSCSLSRAEDWIADDILGEPIANIPSGPEKRSVVIAYRTGDLDAPENTLAGIRKAKQEGARAVHIDVRFTKDNIAVLMHDERIDRSTDSSGFICDLTISQVKALDASSKHVYHKKYKGEMVPSLEEALRLCIDLKMKVFIHMWESDEKSLVTVVEMYKKYPPLYESAAVLSFYPYYLYQLRQRDSGIVTALFWRPCFFSVQSPTGVLEEGIRRNDTWLKHTAACMADHILDWCVHHIVWHVAGISAIFVHKDVVSPDYLRQWARIRMRVLTWTVNDCREKIYLGQVLHLGYMTGTVTQHRAMQETPARSRATQSPPTHRMRSPPQTPAPLSPKPSVEEVPCRPEKPPREPPYPSVMSPEFIHPDGISNASSIFGSSVQPKPLPPSPPPAPSPPPPSAHSMTITPSISLSPTYMSPVRSLPLRKPEPIPEPPPEPPPERIPPRHKPRPPSSGPSDMEALMIIKD